EQHLAGAVMSGGGMRDGRAAHGDRDHVLLGDLDAFLDGGRDFLGLAGAVADLPLAVADDDEGAEAEVLAALDDLRHAVDVDDLVDHPALVTLLAPAIAALRALAGAIHWTLHVMTSLELQTVFARRIGERFDVAVIDVAAAVEHDLGDALVLGLLGDERADGLGRGGVRPLRPRVLLPARGRGDGLARGVVDHLRVDVLQAAEDGQARTIRGTVDLAANPLLDTLSRDDSLLCLIHFLGSGLSALSSRLS